MKDPQVSTQTPISVHKNRRRETTLPSTPLGVPRRTGKKRHLQLVKEDGLPELNKPERPAIELTVYESQIAIPGLVRPRDVLVLRPDDPEHYATVERHLTPQELARIFATGGLIRITD